jgi:hypothetical protein
MLNRYELGKRNRNYKKVLDDLSPYAGDQWWALSRDACLCIMNFMEKRGNVVRFFENTDCPDESIFQTILGHTDFKSRMARNVTYTEWLAGKWNPEKITHKHLVFFRNNSSFSEDEFYGSGDMLFARKFADDSEDIVLALQRQSAHIGSRTNA